MTVRVKKLRIALVVAIVVVSVIVIPQPATAAPSITLNPSSGQPGDIILGSEIWLAKTPSGDRPVLILTRDPVADRIGSVVVAALTRTRRGLVSELELTPEDDGVPGECVANFDNIHTLSGDALRRPIAKLSPHRLSESCSVLADVLGC